LTFNPEFAEFPCPAERTLSGSIPTLEQVLMDASKSGLHVKIELKGPGTVEPSLEVVERLDMLNQCSFSSFDLERIAYFRRLRPNQDVYRSGAIFGANLPDDYLEQASTAGVNDIHLRYDTCRSEIISEIHEAGFGSLAWFRGPIGMSKDISLKYWDVGNEDSQLYQVLVDAGVQQMCINKPDVLIALRERLQQEQDDTALFSESIGVTNTTTVKAMV
jgi:glycerophosphoryl diester phosphodiesterase